MSLGVADIRCNPSGQSICVYCYNIMLRHIRGGSIKLGFFLSQLTQVFLQRASSRFVIFTIPKILCCEIIEIKVNGYWLIYVMSD